MANANGFAELTPNRFRAALACGRPLIGIWSQLNSLNATEGLSRAGFDWLMIDGEHAPLSLADAINHLRLLEAGPCVPLVRLVWNDPVLMKQYLDAGATTVMIPYVQTRAEAEAAVRSMRYPPRGTRGVAGTHRASRYGLISDYSVRAEESLFLIVQIETRPALDRIEEIASVDGVDAVFFGPSDLSASIGLLGQPDHPKVYAMIDEGLRRARATGKAAGVLAPSQAAAERHVAAGFDFVSVASDLGVLFRNAEQIARRYAAAAEAAVGKRPAAAAS